MTSENAPTMIRKLVDSLYVEAMVLTDEARAYFDEFSKGDRSRMDPVVRVSFSCESLKVTTRLMHVIAWLLTQKGYGEGNPRSNFIVPIEAPMRLGAPVISEDEVVTRLPKAAQNIISASIDLYERVKRLDADMLKPAPSVSPAHSLLRQIERAY